MATTTTNLGLVIPAMGDAPNINVVSQAFEGVDSFAGGVVAGSTDQYDSSATYAIGDLCIYNNTLYKCNTAISTPEAWDSTHWTQSSLANEVGTLTDQINYAGATSFTPTWGTGTYTGGFTEMNAKYARSGNVVMVTMVFKMSANASSSQYYINMTNLPYSSNMNATGVLRVTNTAKIGSCATNTGTTLQLFFTLADGTYPQSGQYINLSVSYTTSDP